MITLGSLFDGIGGWLLAATRNNITPLWASEIEPFCISVTKKHFPSVQHLGDITRINGADIEPVDIVAFGSPCQDLSIIKTNREGLSGARSGLFKHAIRIIREMRTATNNQYPKFIVWENVPGAFSSNKGYDFRTVLQEVTEAKVPMPRSGRWANAGLVRSSCCEVGWRVLDAQYWGVPQRRKRIFLVASFGRQGVGEILFKSESVFGNTKKGESKGQRTASGNVDSIKETICLDIANPANNVNYNIAPTLCSRMGTGGNQVPIIIAADNRIRQLTPGECERLQGLPDGWTTGGSDAQRYKALGNAMAQCCADFIIEGISKVIDKEIKP